MDIADVQFSIISYTDICFPSPNKTRCCSHERGCHLLQTCSPDGPHIARPRCRPQQSWFLGDGSEVFRKACARRERRLNRTNKLQLREASKPNPPPAPPHVPARQLYHIYPTVPVQYVIIIECRGGNKAHRATVFES